MNSAETKEPFFHTTVVRLQSLNLSQLLVDIKYVISLSLKKDALDTDNNARTKFNNSDILH